MCVRRSLQVGQGTGQLFYVGVQLESQNAVLAGIGDAEGAVVAEGVGGNPVGIEQLAGSARRFSERLQKLAIPRELVDPEGGTVAGVNQHRLAGRRDDQSAVPARQRGSGSPGSGRGN